MGTIEQQVAYSNPSRPSVSSILRVQGRLLASINLVATVLVVVANAIFNFDLIWVVGVALGAGVLSMGAIVWLTRSA